MAWVRAEPYHCQGIHQRHWYAGNSNCVRCNQRHPQCGWHDDYPIDYDSEDARGAYCPDCGSMYMTKLCKRCGWFYIDWQADTSDDVVVSARTSRWGDATCNRCIKHYPDDDYDPETDFGELQ